MTAILSSLPCRCGDSDSLAVLRALCAFEAAGCSDAWAADHYLHARNLREMADLHKQLVRVLQVRMCDS